MKSAIFTRSRLIGTAAACTLAGAALVCTGCSGAGHGAGVGAILGTAAGAVIGHQSGHAGEGAAIGAGAGALLGYMIGNEADKERHRYYRHDGYYRDDYQSHYYQPAPRYRYHYDVYHEYYYCD